MVANKTRQRLGERDRTALIALAGVIVSIVVWFLWSWVSAILSNESLSNAAFAPVYRDVVGRLSAIVVVMLGTLLAQTGYARWFRTVERLRIERSRVEQLCENSADALFSLTPDRTIEYGNPAAAAMVGTSTESMVGQTCHKAIWARDEPCDDCPAAEVVATGGRRERDLHDTSTGSDRWFDHDVYPVISPTGSVASVVEVYRDVTSLRNAEEGLREANRDLESRVSARTHELAETNDALQAEVVERERNAGALRESEQRFRLLVDESPDMVLVHSAGEVVYLNPAGAWLLGLDKPDHGVGLMVRDLWEPSSAEFCASDIERAMELGELSRPMPVFMRRANGELMDVELSVGKLEYAGAPAIQCVVRDVTERVNAQRTIERMAFFDPLTELPNRVLFHDRLSAALARARRRGQLVAVVFVDLDDFKTINDTLGHVVGDAVLKAVAERLKDLLREEDTIARQSGDEFTIIARVDYRDGAAFLASRVLDSLKNSLRVSGYELHVSASVGIAVYPLDGLEEAELMRHADTAMYRAKELGRNVFQLYDRAMSESARDRLKLESGLRTAVELQQFVLHYQPQIDVYTGLPVGVEALIRWEHPSEGMLPPHSFIRLAEQTGFMGEIGHWVLRTACERAGEWYKRGYEFGRICVNLSAREFVQEDIVANVRAVLAATELPPSMLELEITESAAMHNLEHVLAVLGELRGIGVRVAIDDFGTGYSSMSYLKRFPINTLKIAQDFMRDVHVNAQSAAIAGMMIDLCHELKFDIVAEGVEHQEQLDFLRERGCTAIQGFLFSAPVPEEHLLEILSKGPISNLSQIN